jgi:hypothetical protein
MPSKYYFVGPSLPDSAELAAGTGIHIMPPVAAGDLLRLDVRAGDVVAIVDGYFHQTRSVRHKEILDLLGRGVHVLGASSMGALRAAELDRFGMRGFGSVYADYSGGRLEADDEVTLLHSPPEEGYRPQSEPLVCMRATFAAAVQQGVCDASTADRLVEFFAQRPFGLRSYAALPEAGEETGLDATAVRALQSYCIAHRQDPKREDALLLLDHLRDDDALAGPEYRRKPPTVHRTAFLYAWQLVQRTTRPEDGAPPESTLDLLRAYQLFADDYPGHYRNLALRTLASLCVAECGEQAVPGTDAERALLHGEHHGLYRLPARRERLPFLGLWMTPAEAGLSLAEQLTIALVRSCRTTLRLPWEEIALSLLEEPSLRDTSVRFVRLAVEVNDRALGDRPDLGLDVIPRDKIVDLLAEHWRTSSETLELAALDRGFVSLDNAVSAARLFYLFARYNDVTGQLRVTPPTSP